jgi:hypothetical protein
MNLGMPKVRREYAHRNCHLQQNQVQGIRLQKVFSAVRAPRDRGDQGRLGNRKEWCELLEHATLWLCANHGVLQLALIKQQQSRNTHNVELARDVWVLVDVDLCDCNRASLLCSDLFEDGRNLLAWPTPLGPEVDKDGGRRTIDGFVKC